MLYQFFVPKTDTGASEKLNQFMTGFTENFEALGFDDTDETAVQAAVEAFGTSLSESDLAKSLAENAVNQKNMDKATAIEVVRSYVMRIKTNPAATSKIMGELGISPAGTYAGPVEPPVDLSASPAANGTCKLKWAKGGNAPGTVWLIESSTDGGVWTSLATSTAVKYTDNNAAAGIQKLYRVRAQRKGVTSAPSAAATIFPSGEGFGLEVAA